MSDTQRFSTRSGADDVRPDELFVNFGAVAERDKRVIFALNVDTWYVQEVNDLGYIDIGEGPVTPEAGMPGYVCDRLSDFFSAFAGLVRISGNIRLLYKLSLDDVRTHVYRATAQSIAELYAELQAGLPAPSCLVTLVTTECDVMVSLREADGTIKDRWLTNQSQIDLRPMRSLQTVEDRGEAAAVPWRAVLSIRVASLFRRSNRQALSHARVLWNRLRKQDTGLTAFPESSDEDLLVTLADTSERTPRDNVELYRRNRPHLDEAIAQWEAVTGRQFEWLVSLDN